MPCPRPAGLDEDSVGAGSDVQLRQQHHIRRRAWLPLLLQPMRPRARDASARLHRPQPDVHAQATRVRLNRHPHKLVRGGALSSQTARPRFFRATGSRPCLCARNSLLATPSTNGGSFPPHSMQLVALTTGRAGGILCMLCVMALQLGYLVAYLAILADIASSTASAFACLVNTPDTCPSCPTVGPLSARPCAHRNASRCICSACRHAHPARSGAQQSAIHDPACRRCECSHQLAP